VDAGFGAIAGARFTVVLGQAGTDQEDTFRLGVGGSLAGSNLNLVTLQVPGAQASGTLVTRSFVVGNSAANIANLKSAYAQLLNGHDGVAVTTDDIAVSYSRTSAGERYVVSFVGKLAGTDIDPKGNAFDFERGSWSRLVYAFGDVGDLVHPRYESYGRELEAGRVLALPLAEEGPLSAPKAPQGPLTQPLDYAPDDD
jgi:hypothetical protein